MKSAYIGLGSGHLAIILEELLMAQATQRLLMYHLGMGTGWIKGTKGESTGTDNWNLDFLWDELEA